MPAAEVITMKIRNRKEYRKARRGLRVKKRVEGTPDRPRLTVFRSLKHIYAQVIDETAGRTLASACSLKLVKVKAADDASRLAVQAGEVGKRIAEAAKEKGVTKVRFDRGGCLYHGRVAALADSARKNGLEF